MSEVSEAAGFSSPVDFKGAYVGSDSDKSGLGAKGWLYFTDDGTGTIYKHDGSGWVDLGIGGSSVWEDPDGDGVYSLKNGSGISIGQLFTESTLYDAVVWTDGSSYYADGPTGEIASGGDAATVIQAALDYPVDDNRDTGRVAIRKGLFPLGTTVDVREGVKVDVNEGAIFEPELDVDLLNFLPDSQWSGGAINARNGVGYTSSAIVHQGTSSGGVQHGPRNTTTVENVFVALPDTTGTAVHLRTTATDLEHVTWTTHEEVSVFRGQYGFHLDNPNTSSSVTPYTNANFFDTCWTFQTVRSFELEGPGGSECDGNFFTGCQIQAGGNSEKAFYVDGGRNNQFFGCFPWDWGAAATAEAIEMTSSSIRNQYVGEVTRSQVADNGANSINGYSEAGTAPSNSAKWQDNEGAAENLGVLIWDTSTSPPTAYRALGGSFIPI
jgi:hypothetical protein